MQLRITAGPDAGKTVDVEGDEFTIGRDPSCSLALADGKASRRHAAIRPAPDGRGTLYDLGSSNGTFVNGQRVQSVLLGGGERIQIGDTVMEPAPVAVPAADGATSVGRPVPAGFGQQPTSPPSL